MQPCPSQKWEQEIQGGQDQDTGKGGQRKNKDTKRDGYCLAPLP
jgi:hypothetical protein